VSKTTIPTTRFTAAAHKWQIDALEAHDTGRARYQVLVWHRRSRKTTLALNLLIREAARRAKSVFTYVGPTYRQARQMVWEDPNMLFSSLPPQSEYPWKKNDTEMLVRFPNESLLRIMGGDDPDRLRGLDTVGVVFDEWAQMRENIWTEIFRPIIAQDAERWAWFLFTPKGQNHAYMLYQDAVRLMNDGREWRTSLLTADQSALIPADELIKMRAELPRALYDQEMLCAFVTDEERSLITSRMLEELRKFGRFIGNEGRRLVSCDPSQGGDECVIYAFEDTNIIGHKFLRERDPMKISAEVQSMGAQYSAELYVVDSVGIGWGLVGHLESVGCKVARFDSGRGSTDPKRFSNLKAEAWFNVAREIRDHQVAYPQDAELRRQLSSVRYTVTVGDRIKLDSKDQARKELGCSPDRADAFVMGLWGLQYAENRKKRVKLEPLAGAWY